MTVALKLAVGDEAYKALRVFDKRYGVKYPNAR